MWCLSTNPVQRRFTIQMWIAAGLCIVFALVSVLAFRLGHPRAFFAYPLAVFPALPIIGALVCTGTYLAEETDEFQRSLLVQSLLGGIGVTLSATTIWGNLEHFVHFAPHFDAIWVYPMFWLATALSYPVVRMRYR
jgi:hypothetical protein